MREPNGAARDIKPITQRSSKPILELIMTTNNNKTETTKTFKISGEFNSSKWERVSNLIVGISLSLAFALVGAILGLAVQT